MTLYETYSLWNDDINNIEDLNNTIFDYRLSLVQMALKKLGYEDPSVKDDTRYGHHGQKTFSNIKEFQLMNAIVPKSNYRYCVPGEIDMITWNRIFKELLNKKNIAVQRDSNQNTYSLIEIDQRKTYDENIDYVNLTKAQLEEIEKEESGLVSKKDYGVGSVQESNIVNPEVQYSVSDININNIKTKTINNNIEISPQGTHVDRVNNMLTNAVYNGFLEKDSLDFKLRELGVSDTPNKKSDKYSPYFNSTTNKFKKSKFELKIVYGSDSEKIVKIIDVIPRAESQEIDASGNAIYDVYDFIAKDIIKD